MMTSDIIGALPDIPRTFTAFSEWAACLVYISLLKRRFRVVPHVGIIALFAGILLGVQLFADLLPLSLWILGMTLAVLAMAGFIQSCCAVSTTETWYFSARALVVAEFTASLEWQLHCYIFAEPATAGPIYSLFLLLLTNILIMGLVYFLESRHFDRETALDISGKDTLVAGLIALATFAISNLSFIDANTPFSTRMGAEIFLVRTLVDLCGYVAMYAQQEQRQELRTKSEVELMDSLLRSQHDQYLLSRSNIETLNRRYHDLKHQIGVIRAETNPEVREAFLAELEESVSGYESIVKTGNGVIDTILTIKLAACQRLGISLSIMADGNAVEFMRPIDLSALLGNALDNAIEATEPLSDPAQRQIRLRVHEQSGFAMIRVENYFDGPLQERNGEYSSTKENADTRGFGIRSIRHTAAKYNGTVTIRSDGHWFSLRVLIPTAGSTDRG